MAPAQTYVGLLGTFTILFLAIFEVVAVMYVALVTTRAFHKARPVGTHDTAVLFDIPWSSPWLGELDITTSLRGGVYRHECLLLTPGLLSLRGLKFREQ